MKNIKVLGTGCRICEITATIITQAAKEAGTEVELEKVTDVVEIMGYGVMTTPSVVVDGKVVHSGGLPGTDEVREMGKGLTAFGMSFKGDSPCCGRWRSP